MIAPISPKKLKKSMDISCCLRILVNICNDFRGKCESDSDEDTSDFDNLKRFDEIITRFDLYLLYKHLLTF